MLTLRNHVTTLCLASFICELCCASTDCVHTYEHENGTLLSREFRCSGEETCCGDQCCADSVEPTPVRFYTLWYFWLSVIFVAAVSCGIAMYYFKKKQQSHDTIVTIQKNGTQVNIHPPDGDPVPQERLFFTTLRTPMGTSSTTSDVMAIPPSVRYTRTPSPYHGNAIDLEPLQYPAYGHRALLTPLPENQRNKADSSVTNRSSESILMNSSSRDMESTLSVQTRCMLQPVYPAYHVPGQLESPRAKPKFQH